MSSHPALQGALETSEIATPHGILYLRSLDGQVVELTRNRPARSCSPQKDAALHQQAAAELKAYFAGTSTGFTLPVQQHGTLFRRKVWAAMARIPAGQTRTYGQIAAEIGSPKAARAVGAACGANPVPILGPCHRVVASSAKSGGFAWGMAVKEALLKLEGAA